MSELQAPICDYQNALQLFHENLQLITNPSLLFVAADICSSWSSDENVFLAKLRQMWDSLNDFEKSVYIYLLAEESKSTISIKEYIILLKQSVSLSENCRFVNNRRALSLVTRGKESKMWQKEAVKNVVHISKPEDEIDELEFLKSESYVAEFITGTDISYINYEILMQE